MNWLYSFIAAFALIFTIPVVNNYDEVKIIVNDIKNAIIKEINSEELLAKLSDFYIFGSMENNVQSNIPDEVFDVNYEGDIDKDLEKHKPENSKTWETDKQTFKEIRQNYLDSTTPTKMLELSAEVYEGEIFPLITEMYPVTKENVESWTVVSKFPKDKPSSENGTSIKLWVNNYDSETYCISIAGTDALEEIVEQYIPMETSPTYSTQQREISEYVKNIRKYIKESKNYSKCGEVKKLFVTGHSMGAFYAMWLGTDLYDSDSYSLTKCSDIGPYLKSANIKTYTYAAPGLLTEIPSNLPKAIKDLLGVGDRIPDWSKHKLENDKKNKYDTMLYQYTNELDIVPNLNKITEYNWLSKDLTKKWVKLNFVHLGKHYNFSSGKLTNTEYLNALKRFNLFEAPIQTFLNGGALIVGLEYHLPHQYLKGFKNNLYKLV